MESKSIRRIRLQRKYCLLTGWDYRTVPWLNVSGIWLERAGFNSGDRVGIKIGKHKLVIKNLGADIGQ